MSKAKKTDGEIFAKTLETIVAKIGTIETRLTAAETANETTIKTVVSELKAIVERIEKLESAAAVPGLESDLKAIVDRLKTEPAAVPTEIEPAKPKPIFEKPTAEEASRRARKAWETRRARRGNGTTGKTVDIAAAIAAAVKEAMAAK